MVHILLYLDKYERVQDSRAVGSQAHNRVDIFASILKFARHIRECCVCTAVLLHVCLSFDPC